MQKNLMNILRPLSPHLPIYKQRWWILFIFLATLVLLFYLLCMVCGYLELIQYIQGRLPLCLGGRALSLALRNWLGCSGGLALAFVFVVKAFLTAEAAPLLGNSMAPSGADEVLKSLLPQAEVGKGSRSPRQ